MKHHGILAVWCNDIGIQYGGDCGVGVTLQMCNRVTNPWDICIFFQIWTVMQLWVAIEHYPYSSYTHYVTAKLYTIYYPKKYILNLNGIFIVYRNLSRKNTHISRISNSVTHLRSYTNTAIAETQRRVPILPHPVPKLPHWVPISSHRTTSVWVFHNVLTVFHDVLLVVHNVLRVFYMCFMMFFECLTMFLNV